MGKWQCTVENMAMNPDFWRKKRVFITGHTGFKGGWLALWLQSMGAEVTGYALPPQTSPNFFELANVAQGMTSIIADMCDSDTLAHALQQQNPDIVLHLAAQSLVRHSYEKPVETFTTNIMGTIHLLEAIRTQKTVHAVLVVTSDKCYENREWLWGYRENDPMGGRDPYSSSKGCVELVSASYRHSFLQKEGVFLATARAGNVIGGGDWSTDRLVPDILRAIHTNTSFKVRNPLATRPWQHVLEPLGGYLLLAEKLWEKKEIYASAWNFGPTNDNVRSVNWIIERLAFYCDSSLSTQQVLDAQPHEAQLLSLDSTKAYNHLAWKSRWSLEQTLSKIADWHHAWVEGDNMRDISLQQILHYTEA